MILLSFLLSSAQVFAFQPADPSTPYDTFRLLDQEVETLSVLRPGQVRDPKQAPVFKGVTYRNIQILFVKGEGDGRQELGRIDRLSGQSSFGIESPDPTHIEIWQQQQLLHVIHIDVRSAALFGPYFVFSERGGYLSESGAQNLLFIDLKTYQPSLGRADLPVFRFQIKSNQEVLNLISKEGALLADQTPISVFVFTEVSRVGQVAFNVASNLSDPTFYQDSVEPVSELFDTFLKSAEISHAALQTKLGSRTNDFNLHLNFADGMAAENPTALRKYVEQFSTDPAVRQKLDSSIEAQVVQRKLAARLGRVLTLLTLPHPTGSAQIKSALAFISGGLLKLKDDFGQARADLTEGALQLLHSKWMRRGVAPAAAFLMGAQYPEAVAGFLQAGLGSVDSLINTVFGQARETATDTARIAWSSLETMTSGMSPAFLWDRFMSAENQPKFFHGVWTVTKFVVIFLGTSHLMVNGYKLVADLRDQGLGESLQSEGGWVRRTFSKLKRLGSWFIEREEAQKAQYLANQAEGNYGAKAATFTEEEEAQVTECLALIASAEKGGFGQYVRTFAQLPIFNGIRSLTQTVSGTQIGRFGKALGEFFVGLTSLTQTTEATIRFWNYIIYPVRTFLFNPLTLLPVYFVFPEMFLKTFSKPAGVAAGEGQTIPTQWNGGTRNIIQTIRLKITNRSERQQMERVEDHLLAVEWAIQGVAESQALRATLDYIDSQGDLLKISAAGGIDGVEDSLLKEVAPGVRRFYQHFYHELLDRCMRLYLQEKLGVDPDIPDRTLREMALSDVDQLTSTPVSSVPVTSLVERALAASDSRGYRVSDVAELATHFRFDREQWWTSFKFKILDKLDPRNNRPMKRVVLTHEALKDPKLIQRVTLKGLSKWVIDLPQEFILTLLLFAGATSPDLMPIQPEMFSDTSWHYLSAPLFKGWLAGVITTFLANAWLDLQMFARQKDEFGKVPENTKETYLGWFMKSGMRAPDNSLFENWKDSNSLVIANIKSALSLAVALNFFIFGRFELDLYFTGYMITLLSPISAISYKIENAFERSSDYFLKDVPEPLRKHPRIQEWLAKRKGSARVVFNFWYRLLYENPVGFLLQFMQLTQMPDLGQRSFIKTLWLGLTPTQYAENMFLWVEQKVSSSPMLQGAVRKCALLFTKNYPIKPGE